MNLARAAELVAGRLGARLARTPPSEPEPMDTPEPEHAPRPEPIAPGRRRPTLGRLEAAIDANPWLPDEHVYALEALLYCLRDYADLHGNLPPEFDGLVEQEFGELLGPHP